MCLFKKKKKIVIDSKYKLGEFVHFRYKGEICPAYVQNIYFDNFQNILYDLQIGGECPAVISGVKEEEIIIIKRVAK